MNKACQREIQWWITTALVALGSPRPDEPPLRRELRIRLRTLEAKPKSGMKLPLKPKRAAFADFPVSPAVLRQVRQSLASALELAEGEGSELNAADAELKRALSEMLTLLDRGRARP